MKKKSCIKVFCIRRHYEGLSLR